ncbi:MAG: hypothetical protein R2788_26610 [Saprospiraceae bacterium]
MVGRRGEVTEIIGHENSVLSLMVFDKETVISASRDMYVKIWKIIEDEFQLAKILKCHEGTVLCLCKINEYEFLSGGADGMLNQITGELKINSKLITIDLGCCEN